MLISVIIPTYNHAEYILQTLHSVFEQTLQDFEIIVVNDGSPDNVADVLKPFIDQRKIRYFEQSNAGAAAARNRGITEAQGQFIAFLDDDDVWPPDKLACQSDLLQRNSSAVLVYGSGQVLDKYPGDIFPYGDAPSGYVRDEFMRCNWIWSPGQSLIRTEAIKAIGGFDEQLWGVDDWDMYIRLSNKGEFIYDHHLALYYRIHALNASKNYGKMFENLLCLHKKHFGTLPRKSNFHEWVVVRQAIGNVYFYQCTELAQSLSKRGEMLKALQLWLLALRMNPFRMFRHIIRSVINIFA